MECSCGSCDALGDDFGVCVDEDGHCLWAPRVRFVGCLVDDSVLVSSCCVVLCVSVVIVGLLCLL